MSSSGAQGNGGSGNNLGVPPGPAISGDGRFVAFASTASNLVAGDTNKHSDIFMRDRVARTTTRVSVGSRNGQANGDSMSAAISANGRFVAFASYASNLVTGDTKGVLDVFVRDRKLGTPEQLSVSSRGVRANGDSGDDTVAISGDGRFVAFASTASNLVAGDTKKCLVEDEHRSCADLFVRDRKARATTRVSLSSRGVQANGDSFWAAISANGRFVAYQSLASNLVAGDTNKCTSTGRRQSCSDVFVRDRKLGATTLISAGRR